MSVDWIDYQHEDVVEQLVEMAMDEADDEIARVLSQMGITAGAEAEEAALEAKIKQGLRDRFACFRSENTKRVQNVTYDCTFTAPDGSTSKLNDTTDEVNIRL